VARVPEAELERLKAEVSVQRLAEAAGVELRRHGADLLGLCPFHDDHEPSLVISPGKNLWHCMGACQAGGSCVDWVMRAEGVSFRHAVELLRAGDVSAFSAPRQVKASTVRTLPSPLDADTDDRELLRQVAGYYADTLREAPEAQQYLESRGLAHADALRIFRLGFANRTLGLRLPAATRRAGEEVRSRLQGLGILRPSGHEHFNGSLVVPVLTPAGDVAEMYGRKITPGLRPGTPLHCYLPGPHRGVWNEAGLSGARQVIVCEALLDALTFWVHGITNVTAAYGVEGFTDELQSTLVRLGVERVDIAYDRDAAGDKAAVQLATRLVAAGIDAYRVQFPRDLDANAYACLELSTAGERLAEVMRRAVWLGKGQADARAQAAQPSAGGTRNGRRAGERGTRCTTRRATPHPATCAPRTRHHRRWRRPFRLLLLSLLPLRHRRPRRRRMRR
jgi:DNA primase